MNRSSLTSQMTRRNGLAATQLSRRNGLAATQLSRRNWLAATTGTVLGSSLGGWLRALAAATETADRPKRSCLLLWMNGGPSQTDTFDLKPGHAHGGPFKAIATRTPGVSISEHLPRIASWTNRLAIVRSMSTREGDHDRAALNLRTGYAPQGSIQFPVLGSLVSKEFERTTGDLPNYVSILPDRRAGLGPSPAGFLGADYAPFLIGDDARNRRGRTDLAVENLALPADVS